MAVAVGKHVARFQLTIYRYRCRCWRIPLSSPHLPICGESRLSQQIYIFKLTFLALIVYSSALFSASLAAITYSTPAAAASAAEVDKTLKAVWYARKYRNCFGYCNNTKAMDDVQCDEGQKGCPDWIWSKFILGAFLRFCLSIHLFFSLLVLPRFLFFVSNIWYQCFVYLSTEMNTTENRAVGN